MDNHWMVYNKALIPKIEPHLVPKPVKVYDVISKNAIFARWTTCFDCGYETEWWYCIKDNKFNINDLKTKRRYEINKGIKNINVCIINQADYAYQISDILLQCLEEYPQKYKPTVSRQNVIINLKQSIEEKNITYFGCFDREQNILIGYAYCSIENDVLNLIEVKILPEYLKSNANAALIYFLCENYLNTNKVKYLCDGERNIRHQTNYQDYLIKYFGFRRAYCKLNILYTPPVKLLVNLLFPFRRIIKDSDNRLIYNIYCLLVQEEIRRTFIK
jgi:hypothetical protein